MMVNTNSYINNSWWTMGKISNNLAINRNLANTVNNSVTGSSYTPNLSNAFPNASLKAGADALISSLNSMRTDKNSPFLGQKAASSNNDLLSVSSYDSSKLKNAGFNNLNIDVIQVAKSQVNQGYSMKANDKAFLDSNIDIGTHTFTLGVNNSDGGTQFYNFDIYVSSTDTNKDVQQKIADEINKKNADGSSSFAKSGVEARVDYNSETGESRLIIQSSATGVNNTEKPNFTLTQRDAKNALSVIGGDAVTQAAQDSKYRVNFNGVTGSEQTSKSNNVDLFIQNMKVELKDVGNAKIDLVKDDEGQMNAFRDMVNTFNSLMSKSEGRFAQELSRVAGSYSGSLSRLGVTMNNGTMQIDEKKLRSAAESGALEKFINDGARSNYGFINRLSQTAANIGKNSSVYSKNNDSFITSWGNQNSDLFGYNNYTNLLNMGFLFEARY